MIDAPDALRDAVLREALNGLLATPKTLSPWLFYDAEGSRLFEQITTLPEYYLTRTERALFAEHCDQILALAAEGERLTLVELGAGSASKTGLLLRCLTAKQGSAVYQPIDVSASALDDAAASIEANIPGVDVQPLVANYITESFTVAREPGERALALYIGSSIGNFSPAEATAILRNLREHLERGDALLLGTDLAPALHSSNGNGTHGHKTVAALLAAYDDAAGVTAAFNRNILARLNRELQADFALDRFTHRAVWNPAASRMEMHLVSECAQTVHVAGDRIRFAAGESIHTENSYKFTPQAIDVLLGDSGLTTVHRWTDAEGLFAVTLARV